MRQRLGREEAKVARLEKNVLDLGAMAWGRGSGRLEGPKDAELCVLVGDM